MTSFSGLKMHDGYVCASVHGEEDLDYPLFCAISSMVIKGQSKNERWHTSVLLSMVTIVFYPIDISCRRCE